MIEKKVFAPGISGYLASGFGGSRHKVKARRRTPDLQAGRQNERRHKIVILLKRVFGGFAVLFHARARDAK